MHSSPAPYSRRSKASGAQHSKRTVHLGIADVMEGVDHIVKALADCRLPELVLIGLAARVPGTDVEEFA
jgi:hypothetical protein